MFPRLKISNCLLTLLGSVILAFGLYNIHALSGVTEGGVLGMTLLLEHWFSVSPALSGLFMNALCYVLGWKLLGGQFIGYSFVAAAGFSVTYGICEQFPPLWPQLENMPLAASVLGAVFVGVGTGFCVRAGGAPSGDDALAMSISHRFGMKIQTVYLISDLLVLGLSITYIPLTRIGWSLLTVILSGQLVGLLQKLPVPVKRKKVPKNS